MTSRYYASFITLAISLVYIPQYCWIKRVEYFQSKLKA